MSQSPHYYITKKALAKQFAIRRKANPVYLKACAFFEATLIDRTSTLDAGLDFSIIDRIPIGTTELNFEEICHQRATEITTSTTGKIVLLWSGGIDSTLALISLIKTFRAHDELDRLTLLLSEESIAEYPSFYEDEIRHKLSHQIIEGTIYDHITPEDILVTGEHGDQLFGSDKLKIPILRGDAYIPYEEILDFIISRKFGTEKYTQRIIDFLHPLIAQSPVKIHTLYDYMWWLNFSAKWQSVSLRLIYGLERQHTALGKTVFHFYRSDDFQKWSLANHHLKIRKNWNSYKYIAKEIIYQYHKDEDYLINKEKEPSLKEVIVRKNEKTGFFSTMFSSSQ